ncbi:MAG: hypothetical protein MRK02_08285 [Candidatus Scalindua sp.]|nr:hypothetical protein [Candidatus Scalindua sp.]
MKKIRLYIDTSVLGGLTDTEDKNRVDIAMGVVHDCDYIVSWNYKHMVNITVRRLSNSVNLKMGYKSIEIISPEEVIGYGEVEI